MEDPHHSSSPITAPDADLPAVRISSPNCDIGVPQRPHVWVPRCWDMSRVARTQVRHLFWSGKSSRYLFADDLDRTDQKRPNSKMETHRAEVTSRLDGILTRLNDAVAVIQNIWKVRLSDIDASLKNVYESVKAIKSAMLHLADMESEVREYRKDMVYLFYIVSDDEMRVSFMKPFGQVDWEAVRKRRKSKFRTPVHWEVGWKSRTCIVVGAITQWVSFIDSITTQLKGDVCLMFIESLKSKIYEIKSEFMKYQEWIQDEIEHDKDNEFRFCMDPELRPPGIRALRLKKESSLAKQRREDPEPLRKWFKKS